MQSKRVDIFRWSCAVLVLIPLLVFLYSLSSDHSEAALLKERHRKLNLTFPTNQCPTSNIQAVKPKCVPDFFGSLCDHDIFNTIRYLPKPSSSSKYKCKKDPDNEKRITDLQQELDTIYHTCDNAQFLGAKFPPAGLGSTMHYLTYPMAVAYEQKRIMNLKGTLLFGGKSCKDFSCYFERWSTCKGSENNTEILDISFPIPYPHHVPAAYRDKGLFWWKAQLLAYFYRPNKLVRDRVAEIKKELNWKHPIIGMHVRRGDSCSDDRRPPCIDLDVYFRAAKEMKKLYHVDHIFLATDDKDVIQEAKKYKEFKVLSIDIDRSVFESSKFIEWRIIDGEFDAFQIGLSAVIDMMLLSDTDFMISAFSANMARLSYELSYAKKGCFAPFVSLDIPWCFHWGYEWDVGVAEGFMC